MNEDFGTDTDTAPDAQLRDFLNREAARRLGGQRTHGDVVLAIREHVAGPSRRDLAILLASAALGIVILAVMAASQLRAPTFGATPVPTAPYRPAFGLPAVAAGEACPVTDRWLIGTHLLPAGAAVGGKPVYAFVAESGRPAYFEDVGLNSPWKRIDVMWVAELGFQGRFTISAARLDAPGGVSFADITERTPLPSLTLSATQGQPIGESGWTVLYQLPMLVEGSGCYGLRIDTDQGSSVSVFEARPVEDAYHELEQRPLRLPSLASGACPVTPLTHAFDFVGGGAFGTGPVYLVGGAGRAWWVADPRELGPILVRGGRIDRAGTIRFGSDTDLSTPLRLPVHSYVSSAGQPVGWRQFITTLVPSSAGCYGLQVDTLSGSEVLVVQLPD